jgi:hypothetical protein
VPVPVGTISAPLTRVIAFFDAHAVGLSRLVEAIGREDLGKALDQAIAAVTGAGVALSARLTAMKRSLNRKPTSIDHAFRLLHILKGLRRRQQQWVHSPMEHQLLRNCYTPYR